MLPRDVVSIGDWQESGKTLKVTNILQYPAQRVGTFDR
jgi:hypothetical protein